MPMQHRWAAFNLGLLLAEQGDVQGAKDAYQKAIDSGHAQAAAMAASTSGRCWRARGTCRAPRTPSRRPSTPGTPFSRRGPQVALGSAAGQAGGCAGRQGRLPEGHRLRARLGGAGGRTRPRGAADTPGGCAGRQGRLPEGDRLRDAEAAAKAAFSLGDCWPTRAMCRAPRTPTRRPSTAGMR